MSFVASLKIVAQNGTAAVFGKIRTDAKKMGDAFKPVASEARAMTRAIDRIGGGTAAKFAAIRVAARRMADGGFKVAEKAAYGAGYGIGFVVLPPFVSQSLQRIASSLLRMFGFIKPLISERFILRIFASG